VEKAVNGFRKSGIHQLNDNIFRIIDFSGHIEEKDAGFEESAQEQTVCFNIQPANQPTGFSDFQLNTASPCSQSPVAPFVFPLSSVMKQHHTHHLH
jgi:hypothetical protein